MTNALIVTPDTFKQQLIWRICHLLSTQPDNTYVLGENDITFLGDAYPTTIFSKKGKELFIEVVTDDGEVMTESAKGFYIEDLWKIYMACEPIYQQRLVDYANIEG